MKQSNWQKEITKTILFVAATVILVVLGTVYFNDTHYAGALLGAAGGSGGLTLFQLTRLYDFKKNPEKFKKEHIDVKDERNILILANARASSFSLETYIILGMGMYGIYLDQVEFVFAILILWVSRTLFFFYYLSKNNKEL